MVSDWRHIPNGRHRDETPEPLPYDDLKPSSP
jgi:hypothetical protein